MIKIFHIVNPFLEIFLPIALRQTNISANSIHPKNACLFFLDIYKYSVNTLHTSIINYCKFIKTTTVDIP